MNRGCISSLSQPSPCALWRSGERWNSCSPPQSCKALWLNYSRHTHTHTHKHAHNKNNSSPCLSFCLHVNHTLSFTHRQAVLVLNLNTMDAPKKETLAPSLISCLRPPLPPNFFSWSEWHQVCLKIYNTGMCQRARKRERVPSRGKGSLTQMANKVCSLRREHIMLILMSAVL